MIQTARAKSTIPAIQGQFGPRLVTYTSQLDVGSIETILGHDPRSRFWKRLPGDLEYLYRHLQRATGTRRLDAVIAYVEERFGAKLIQIGAFPAVSIGIQSSVIFEEFDGVPGAGFMHLDLSQRNRRVALDGLARMSAALELQDRAVDQNVSEDVRAELKVLLEGFTLPVVFFAPIPGEKSLTLEEFQQLFHDFNFKATPIPARVAIALDHSDRYIQLANRIAEECAAIRDHGGMERKAASLGNRSTALLVQTNMVRFVRGAMEGEEFQKSNRATVENPNLDRRTFGQSIERLSNFLDAFADAMAERWTDRSSLHQTAPGWQALGVIYNDLVYRLKVPDPESAARALARLSWKKTDEVWSDVIVPRKRRDGSTELGLSGAGDNNRKHFIRVLRQHLSINERLADLRGTAEAA